ncbi:MAG TPA: transcription antitermination factor NusB, partial [Candidatus Eremiobacteraceae bacterium]|nr:transcription antitermination factor NusB [Candidatus Eremiobacteraceae bacterium]
MRNADTRRDARELALQALSAGGTQAALDSVLRPGRGGAKQPTLDPRERALATQLTYGVVKMRRALAWSLEKYLRKPLQSLDPALQNVLLLGAYQLLYLKKIPAHSAVDESVRLARRHGHAGTAGVANAVLRKLSAQPLLPPPPSGPDDIAGFGAYASVPDWLAQHWNERFGFTTALRIAEGINASARRALRVNPTRVSTSALQTELAAKNLRPHASRYEIGTCVVLDDLGGTPGVTLAQLSRLGLITVQSEESQLAVHLLNPQRDEIVLDVCAGRGVKAGAIGERLHPDSSKLFALDDS